MFPIVLHGRVNALDLPAKGKRQVKVKVDGCSSWACDELKFEDEFLALGQEVTLEIHPKHKTTEESKS